MLLAKKLLEKGVIRENTEFEAYYNAHYLSCQKNAQILGKFRIVSARMSGDKSRIIFEGLSDDDKLRYFFSNDDIVTLDGMAPARVASIYNLNAKGEDLAAGKRRGRKPKVQIMDVQEASA